MINGLPHNKNQNPSLKISEVSRLVMCCERGVHEMEVYMRKVSKE